MPKPGLSLAPNSRGRVSSESCQAPTSRAYADFARGRQTSLWSPPAVLGSDKLPSMSAPPPHPAPQTLGIASFVSANAFIMCRLGVRLGSRKTGCLLPSVSFRNRCCHQTRKRALRLAVAGCSWPLSVLFRRALLVPRAQGSPSVVSGEGGTRHLINVRVLPSLCLRVSRSTEGVAQDVGAEPLTVMSGRGV